MRPLTVKFGILLAGILLRISAAQAADTPQSFTLDGQLFSDTDATVPLRDTNVGMKIQILDEDRNCVLYEENQSINTLFSKGYFSVQVGSVSGDTKRGGLDVANPMSAIFQNLSSVGGKKISDGTTCTIAAVGGKRRYVRVTISPASLGGGARVLSPDINIDSVPNAIVAERAESLQGLRGTDFLQVNTNSGSALTQANLESFFSSATRFNAMSAIVDGTSTSYIKASAAGAQLPVFAGAPTSPVQGSFWFDTTDQKLKYRTSTTTEILGTGSGSGTVTSVAAAATLGNPITIGGTASVTPTIDIPAAGSGANGYLKSSDWSIFNNKQSTTLADGSIWVGNASAVAVARAPSGDISMNNAGVFTVGKIQNVSVATTTPTDGQILRYDSATTAWTPGRLSVGDLRTSLGAQQFSASCAATQTLTWSSVTDTFSCTNIAGLAASVLTSGTIADARLPSSATAWTIVGSDAYRASGKVGIGNSAPDTTLDVTGTVAVSASIEAASSYVNSGALYAIPDTSVNIRRIDLTANTMIRLPTFTSPSGKIYSMTLFLRQDATGSRTVGYLNAVGDSVKWDSGTAPAISTTPGKITIIQLIKPSDETVWYGSMVWKED